VSVRRFAFAINCRMYDPLAIVIDQMHIRAEVIGVMLGSLNCFVAGIAAL
jgi:hypothetical protein